MSNDSVAQQAERLRAGLIDMVAGGRLTAADIPDDFQWLCGELGMAIDPRRNKGIEVHESSDGTTALICELNDAHLLNILRKIQRQSEAGIELVMPGATESAHVYGEKARRMLRYDSYALEAARRGILADADAGDQALDLDARERLARAAGGGVYVGEYIDASRLHIERLERLLSRARDMAHESAWDRAFEDEVSHVL